MNYNVWNKIHESMKVWGGWITWSSPGIFLRRPDWRNLQIGVDIHHPSDSCGCHADLLVSGNCALNSKDIYFWLICPFSPCVSAACHAEWRCKVVGNISWWDTTGSTVYVTIVLEGNILLILYGVLSHQMYASYAQNMKKTFLGGDLLSHSFKYSLRKYCICAAWILIKV